MNQFLDHLAEDAMPALIEKLSQMQKQNEIKGRPARKHAQRPIL